MFQGPGFQAPPPANAMSIQGGLGQATTFLVFLKEMKANPVWGASPTQFGGCLHHRGAAIFIILVHGRKGLASQTVSQGRVQGRAGCRAEPVSQGRVPGPRRSV